ncbi:MAG: hypothetical protein V5A23_08090 [Halobacteriales archaeon]
MSVIVVPAAPPREGLVLPRLSETSPLSAAEAADLYEVMLQDVCRTVEESGGDLLVNYLPDDRIDERHRQDTPAEEAVRETVTEALDDPEFPRFEEQVGSNYSARVGNTVTHLLEREGAKSVEVVRPTAPAIGRPGIDETAMKLRRRDVVLGASTGGRVYLAGFSDTIDFEDAFAPPPVETLAARGRAAGLDVDFIEFGTLVETGDDLASLTSLLRAHHEAGRIVPERTLAMIDQLGLVVGDGELRTEDS